MKGETFQYRAVNLRSDTFTQPDKGMLRAMVGAKIGEHTVGECPTTAKLEADFARLLGKEDSIFVPTGMMGNQIASRCHCPPNTEIILEETSHIFDHEFAATSALSGIQTRPIRGRYGIPDPKDVENAVRKGFHSLIKTSLICLESPTNMGGGKVITLAELKEFRKIADKAKIPIHLDGARIFNGAAFLRCHPRDIAAYADTVMVCLEKGLGAPVGSILAGDRQLIERAREYRLLFGGAWRKPGHLAAAVLYALRTVMKQARRDNRLAQVLYKSIRDLKYLGFENPVETNIIIAVCEDAPALEDRLKRRGLLCYALSPDRIRLVVHKDITEADIQRAAEIIRSIQ